MTTIFNRYPTAGEMTAFREGFEKGVRACCGGDVDLLAPTLRREYDSYSPNGGTAWEELPPNQKGGLNRHLCSCSGECANVNRVLVGEDDR